MYEETVAEHLLFDDERARIAQAIRRKMNGQDEDDAPDLLGLATLERHHIQLLGIAPGADPINHPNCLVGMDTWMSPEDYRRTLGLFDQLQRFMPFFPETPTARASKADFFGQIKAECGVEYNAYGGIIVYRHIPLPSSP